MDDIQWTTAGLWLAVVASGLYHGVNPGMGWPLAVSAGLMGRGRRDVVAAQAPLAAGHLVSMLVILLPFALMTALLDWQREIRIGASVAVIAFGVFPPRQPTTPACARPDQAHAACALVLRNRNRPRRRSDAAADLSWPVLHRRA